MSNENNEELKENENITLDTDEGQDKEPGKEEIKAAKKAEKLRAREEKLKAKEEEFIAKAKEIDETEAEEKKTRKKKKKKTGTSEEAVTDSETSGDETTAAEAVDGEAADTADTEDSDRKKKRKKKKNKEDEEVNIVKELLSLILYIGIVMLVCYLIITFVGCRSRVDGSSMNPTLSNADNLWVDKLSYTFGDPERFDVIIFNYDEETTYVKRIIGMPGETVRIDQNGNIYINEQLLHEEYGKETIQATNLGRANQSIKLGDDEYFVLGDNRNNSRDSRWADVGNIPRDEIVGKVVLRIYPFKKFGFIH